MVTDSSPKSSLEPYFTTVAQAAEFLALSRWTVTELLDSGAIESTRHGRKRLVVVSSLRKYAKGLLATPQDAA